MVVCFCSVNSQRRMQKLKEEADAKAKSLERLKQRTQMMLGVAPSNASSSASKVNTAATSFRTGPPPKVALVDPPKPAVSAPVKPPPPPTTVGGAVTAGAAAASKPKFCTSCGKPRDNPTAKFCTGCGNKHPA
jgi:hypothetical protein